MTTGLHANMEGRNRVRSIVNRTTELTPLKAVATRAIALAEDERSAAMDLATVISSDQALTAKLLRLSNSAYYGYARRIGNVREAVILLGMRTVRLCRHLLRHHRRVLRRLARHRLRHGPLLGT